MRNCFHGVLALLLLLTGVSTSFALPTVEKNKQAIPDQIGPKIVKLLAPDCYLVKGDNGDTLRFWVRETIPCTSKQDLPAYADVEEGTILGVLEIKGKSWQDFRAQELPEGVFVVRLIFQPQDGDHMGVAPFPEFVGLTPPKEDTEPEALPHDEVAKLSQKTLETGHPAVMFLNPFFKKPEIEFPKVESNDFSHTVLNVATRGITADKKTIEFPIGLIIVGHSQEAN